MARHPVSLAPVAVFVCACGSTLDARAPDASSQDASSEDERGGADGSKACTEDDGSAGPDPFADGAPTCGTSAACPSAMPNCSQGSCMVPPSCAAGGAGVTDCGARSESCCTSLEVPGGTYSRSYTTSGGCTMDEADPASVSGFRLDKYLVTVGRFRAFVSAWKSGSGYVPSAGSGKHAHLNGGKGLANGGAGGGYEPGWMTSDDNQIVPTDAHLTLPCDPYSTWTGTPANLENRPVNCVNWYEAYAFCIWDGGFLPSEAEWEYAGAAGSRQREYPWGTAAPGTANRYAIYGCFYPSGSGTCSNVSNIAPVGTATQGASLWGQLDMAGELWQWNLDFYATYVNPCADCYYMTATTVGRSLRGASYISVASYLPPAGRSGDDPSSRTANYGVRCARAP